MTQEEKELVDGYVARLNSAVDKDAEAKVIGREIISLRRTDQSKRRIALNIAHQEDERTKTWVIKSHSNSAFLAAGEWLNQFVLSETRQTAGGSN